MTEYYKCPNCKNEVPETLYCLECGAPLYKKDDLKRILEEKPKPLESKITTTQKLKLALGKLKLEIENQVDLRELYALSVENNEEFFQYPLMYNMMGNTRDEKNLLEEWGFRLTQVQLVERHVYSRLKK